MGEKLKTRYSRASLLRSATFLAPAILVMLAVMTYPMAQGISLSFTNRLFTYDLYSFVGLQNYVRMLGDDLLWRSAGTSIFLSCVTVSATMVVGIVMALLLNGQRRLTGLFRSALLLPWVMPPMVTALVFRWLYNDSYGYLNYVLLNAGILKSPVNPLADSGLAWIGVAVPIVWSGFPFVMLVFMAALQSIDRTLYDAAHVDGASNLQAFRAVTLPGLRHTIVIVTVLELIWAFSSFDLIHLMTRGGPADSTLTLSLYLYRTGFEAKALGYASALGVVMFCALFALTVLYFRLARTAKLYDA